MKRYLITLCLVICLSAYTKPQDQSTRAYDLVHHNINNIEMVISNFGVFGQHENGSDPGCWWPKGTDRNYIYGAGIWFGTVDQVNGDTLVSTSYFIACCEFLPGLKDMVYTDPDAVIYMYPEEWPPPQEIFPMAPQEAIYQQDSWCCFNDCNPLWHHPGDTRPIGIEVYQTVYAANCPGIEDAVFFTYNIKNSSGRDLHDCYFGIVADCDIGDYVDEYCMAIPARQYFFDGGMFFVNDLCYQWQEDQESGWDPPYPGAIGFDLFQTPFDLEWGQDKDTDGIPDQYERDSVYYWFNLPDSLWDIDKDGVPDWRDASENPRVGMTAFKKIGPGFSNPENDPETYRVLAGYTIPGGYYQPYDTTLTSSNDCVFLMSSGPFDLVSDSIATI